MTGTRSWTLSQGANGRILTLRPNLLNTARLVAKIPARTLAKIDPVRLRRTRALLSAHVLSAAKHWRCLLANTTADDPAFEQLREQPQVTPRFLDGAMKVASYMLSMHQMFLRPTPDGDEPDARKLANVPIERLASEAFEDIREPTNTSERHALLVRNRDLRLRLAGDITAGTTGIALTQEELLDFAKAMSDAPEARKLFCLD